jgi:hypothetical protein
MLWRSLVEKPIANGSASGQFNEMRLATRAIDLCHQRIAALTASSGNEYGGPFSSEQPC